jgi:pectate lyase
MKTSARAALSSVVPIAVGFCSTACFQSRGAAGDDDDPRAGVGTPSVTSVIAGTPAETPACDAEFDPAPVLALAAERPIGWAAVDAMDHGVTTGGDGGEVVLARTLSELQAYAAAAEPMIIAVCGLIGETGLRVEVLSNKTIIGVGTRPTLRASIDIDEAQNIIIRNLYIAGASPDGIATRRTHHAWIDHVDISDSADGNLDVTDESDYVTVSYSRFWYSASPPNPSHRFSNLIGSSDTRETDRGHLKVTMHHNWWADNVTERMPRTRYGDIHVFNNYYSSAGNNYCIRAGVSSTLLVEDNYFFRVSDPLDLEGGNVLERGNVFNAAGGTRASTGTAFEPPYAYEPDPAADVPEIVTSSAGPLLFE